MLRDISKGFPISKVISRVPAPLAVAAAMAGLVADLGQTLSGLCRYGF